jgi:hypothetical protein
MKERPFFVFIGALIVFISIAPARAAENDRTKVDPEFETLI